MPAVRARRTRAPAPPPKPKPVSRLAMLSLKAGPTIGLSAAAPQSAGRWALGASVVLGAAAALAAWMGGSLLDVGEGAARAADSAANAMGLQVREIAIDGIDAKRAEAVRAVALAPHRASLVMATPEAVRARVRSLDWVDDASVARRWPQRLEIVVRERQALARWAVDGGVGVVDAAGERVHAGGDAAESALPLLIGPGAGPAAPAVLEALTNEAPAARARLQAMVYVAQRRFDLRLDGGLTIALPAGDPAPALRRLRALDASARLLSRPLRRIDLRQPNVITVAPLGDGLVPAGA